MDRSRDHNKRLNNVTPQGGCCVPPAFALATWGAQASLLAKKPSIYIEYIYLI